MPPVRALTGVTVSISVSASIDSSLRGFPSRQINHVTVQLAGALCGQGAALIFGHDWREDGVMEAIYALAREMQSPLPVGIERNGVADQPVLYNLLPWPDEPSSSPLDLEALSSTLTVEKAGLPADLEQKEEEARIAGPGSPAYIHVRSRGLTWLRHLLTERCSARICIGGATTVFAGRYPGVVEEALFAVQSSKSLYLSHVLGGAAAQVIDAIEGREMPADFCPSTPATDTYAVSPAEASDTRKASDLIVDRAAVWQTFRTFSVGNLSTINGLTVDENQELFHSPAIDRVIQLILTGLGRVRRNGVA